MVDSVLMTPLPVQGGLVIARLVMRRRTMGCATRQIPVSAKKPIKNAQIRGEFASTKTHLLQSLTVIVQHATTPATIQMRRDQSPSRLEEITAATLTLALLRETVIATYTKKRGHLRNFVFKSTIATSIVIVPVVTKVASKMNCPLVVKLTPVKKVKKGKRTSLNVIARTNLARTTEVAKMKTHRAILITANVKNVTSLVIMSIPGTGTLRVSLLQRTLLR
jgi:galactitol-specific phosphotransferase system IIB component